MTRLEQALGRAPVVRVARPWTIEERPDDWLVRREGDGAEDGVALETATAALAYVRAVENAERSEGTDVRAASLTWITHTRLGRQIVDVVSGGAR